MGKKYPVTCVETGVVYSGQRECSSALGVTVTAVNHVLMGRAEKVRGFTIRVATGDEIADWKKSQPRRLDREEWKAVAITLGMTLQALSDELYEDDNAVPSWDTGDRVANSLALLEGVI